MNYNHIKFQALIEKTIIDNNMLQNNDAVLVGVSGGSDSIALINILKTLSIKKLKKIGIAHINHGLRGDESERDSDFVKTAARKYNLPFYIKKTNVIHYQKEQGLSLEEAGRDVRYKFFYHIMDENGYNKLALGHHANDNAELILMNLLRGSGTLGLSGIPPVRNGRIIRPLINVTKEEIQLYLSENNINFITDSSNFDNQFLRNRVRRKLLPLLKNDFNPNITDTLNRLGVICKSENEWMDSIVDFSYKKCVLKSSLKSVELSLHELKKNHNDKFL